MTDRQLEERLQAWYAAEVPESETAPADLRESITAIPASTPALLRPLGRRPNFTLLALAAVLVVGGALAAGSGLVRLTAIVPPVPYEAAELVPPAPAPSASPAASASASPTAATATTPWITGQELMHELSAAYGYRWSPISNGDPSTEVLAFQSGLIRVEAPVDGPASVEVDGVVDAAAGVRQDADRIAHALAPDATTWLMDSMGQGLAAPDSPGVEADTATGGSVGVEVRHDAPFRDRVDVWFSPHPLPMGWNEPNGSGVVVTAEAGLLQAVNVDGTGAGPLLRGAHDPRRRYASKVARVLGWTPDGSRLFYQDGAGSVLWTDAAGSEPVLVARGTVDGGLCPAAATVDDTCRAANVGEVLLSPDGTQLAYPVDGDSGRYTIGFIDVATGQVTRIAFDSDRSPGGPACEGPFGDGPLQWSPDGTRFTFGNSVGPRVDGWCQAAAFTVNVDGTGLRRVNSSKVHAMEPHWSPDGSTIVFSRSTPRSAWDRKRDATLIPVDIDIYSVRPDGSGLTALTSDGVSVLVTSRTRDGRIVFTRGKDPEATDELWIMDADGANATRLDTSISAMTAAGCLVCLLPDPLGGFDPDEQEQQRLGIPDRGGPNLAYWQPMPGDRP